MTFQAPTNEWDELQAAQRSEADLRHIMLHGAPVASQRDLELARRDAMKAMVVGLPDPVRVAANLETGDPAAAAVLMAAWRDYKPPYFGAWRVANDQHTAVLRAMGLVGWIGTGRNMGCCVGGFGLLVRKVMLLDFEANEGDA